MYVKNNQISEPLKIFSNPLNQSKRRFNFFFLSILFYQYIECWECCCSCSSCYYVTFLPHPRVTALKDWVVMAKVTTTRIEAKNRPHSKEKAFNSIILGIWEYIWGFLRNSCTTWLSHCPHKSFIKMPLKIDNLKC